MAKLKRDPRKLVEAIRASGLTIYDPVESAGLRLATPELEAVLDAGLPGLSLNYPIRTRSKVLKTKVCEVLGYPIPKSFRKTQPRFPGQDFDTYVQKSNNLQIWNEEVSPTRRYVLVRVDDNNIVSRVRVVTGISIAKLDPTGTLTTKYQAKAQVAPTGCVLVSAADTDRVLAARQAGLLPIDRLFEVVEDLCGKGFPDPGAVQERNRGAALHRMICEAIDNRPYADFGQFPDIREQLLEVKLQMSPTIDLGLVSPDSTEPIADMPEFRHCDVRYAVCYAETDRKRVLIRHVVLTTGEDFFGFFRRFGGLVRNAKLQIPLPRNFFDQTKGSPH
jgi:hypothetical protein